VSNNKLGLETMQSTCPVINLAPATILQQLDSIEPGVWGTPCCVTLHDGTSRDICVPWENKRYSDKAASGAWLKPNHIVEVCECQFRLPAKFARIIHDAGESGMGYHIYVVELADGTEFVHLGGNLVIDLLDFPAGYGPADVSNVRPHVGREQSYRQIENYCSLEFARPG
jgi:hypothetical protein